MRQPEGQLWPLPKGVMTDLLAEFRQMFQADSARIISPIGKTMFLIVGHLRNTKDDPGQWVDHNGKAKDWDYTLESCIASGDTMEMLVSSAERYKALLDARPSRCKVARIPTQSRQNVGINVGI